MAERRTRLVQANSEVLDVVMCTWNSDKPWFKNCLQSIKREIPVHCFIVVDRLSEDSTLQTVKQVFPKARVVKTQRKLAEQRRLGIGLVDTPWFVFCDSDIELMQGWHEKIKLSRADNVAAVNGFALPSKDILRQFLLLRLNDKLIRSRKFMATKENPSRIRGLAANTLIKTETVKDWKPPSSLSAYEDHHLLKHIVKKGYKWAIAPQAKALHYGSFSPHSEYSKAKWNSAGGRLIGSVTLTKIFADTVNSVLLTLYGAIKIGNPLLLTINFMTRVGYLEGYLKWNKYLDAYPRV